MLDPRAAYAAADVVVGMGSSALRAMAHGKSVIVQGERGFARTFDEESSSFFLHAGFYGIGDGGSAAPAVAAALADLLPDRTLREALGRLGREVVVDRFSCGHATEGCSTSTGGEDCVVGPLVVAGRGRGRSSARQRGEAAPARGQAPAAGGPQTAPSGGSAPLRPTVSRLRSEPGRPAGPALLLSSSPTDTPCWPRSVRPVRIRSRAAAQSNTVPAVELRDQPRTDREGASRHRGGSGRGPVRTMCSAWWSTQSSASQVQTTTFNPQRRAARSVLGVCEPYGGRKKRTGPPDQASSRLFSLEDVVPHVLRGHRGEALVVDAVKRDLVALTDDPAHQVRVDLCLVDQEEEGCGRSAVVGARRGHPRGRTGTIVVCGADGAIDLRPLR